MIKTVFKYLDKKGIVPPIITKTIKPVGRVWNDNRIPDPQAVKSILDGEVHELPVFDKRLAGKTFFLFAQPKSASKYIKKLFSLVFDAKEYWIGFNRGSGDFYYPRAVGALYTDSLTISHSHSSPNSNITEFLDKINSPILVSYRNLADSLISRRDMLLKDGYASQILNQSAIERFSKGSDSYQMDVIIDLFAPIYLNFFTAWKRESENRKIFFFDYNNFIPNQAEYLLKLSSSYNLSIDRNKIESKIKFISDKGGVNFNKGKAGRGEEKMNKKHKNKLWDLADKFGLEDDEYLGI